MRFLLLLALLALAVPVAVVSAESRDYPPGTVIEAWAAGVCHAYERDENWVIRFVGICGFETQAEPTREPVTTRETTRETTQAPVSDPPPAPPPTVEPEPTVEPTPGPTPSTPTERVEWNGQFMDMSEFLCFQDRARNVFHDTLESTGCSGQ